MRKEMLLTAALLASLVAPPVQVAVGAELATMTVQAAAGGDPVGYDGVVEAVRQTVVSAQVAGTIVALDVKAGEAVKAGQVLARIDANAAQQSVAAGDAQVQSARAALEVATREYERQKSLYAKKYTSQAAMERAEAQYKAAQAQVEAQIAQAAVARTQSGFFVVKAPYNGIVAEVPVTLGDMAMPGKPLVVLYDPAALRVTAAIPQAVAASMATKAGITIEIPSLPNELAWIAPARTEILPTVDPATHTVQMRLELPPSNFSVRPGAFARAWLPGVKTEGTRFVVPAQAIVHRAELTAVYVVDAKGAPVLRQVRIGRKVNDGIEILAGINAADRVVLDPAAAARIR